MRAGRPDRTVALALLLTLLGFAGCAHTGARPEPLPSAPPQPVASSPATPRPGHSPKPHHAWFAEGLASFYGPGLWGHKTANGERLDRTDVTAASRTLEFGTCLRVLNLDNGRSVRVRVNDRGPYVGNRLIDVSYAAGRALGMLEKGLAHVRLFFCHKEPVDLRAAQR